MQMHRLIVAGTVLSCACGAIAGEQVWSGYDFSFAKAPNVDPLLPENQDRITDNVWITRGSAQGIFNAAQESSFTGFGSTAISPIDTEWAVGTTADWDTLTYQTWVLAIGQNPPGSVGTPLVMHLITDDIYIDVMFTSWGQSPASGGTFSYVRAVPAPSAVAMIGVGSLAFSRRRR